MAAPAPQDKSAPGAGSSAEDEHTWVASPRTAERQQRMAVIDVTYCESTLFPVGRICFLVAFLPFSSGKQPIVEREILPLACE